MSRRSLLALGGWLAAAALATVVGVGATRFVGASIVGTPDGIRSQQDVEQALAAYPSAALQNTPAAPAPGQGSDPQPPPSPSGQSPSARPIAPSPAPTRTTVTHPGRHGFSFYAGLAVAECVGSDVQLVSWAPAQGYRVKDVDRGPDDDVKVEFKGPDQTAKLKITCIDGEPVADIDDS
jgi:serine/threonine-protein kinase